MKITNDNGKFKLEWTYKIKNNKKTTTEKEYYFYNVVFPAELADYFQQPSSLWMYENKGHTYICENQPPYTKCKEFKLFSKGNPQRAKDITLSKKFFKELEGYCKGYVQYLFHLDDIDELTHERGLVELRIVMEDNA